MMTISMGIKNGTIGLVGSGEYLPPMDPVDHYLLSILNDEPRVVCLPTAAGTEGAERIRYWSQLGINHFHQLGAKVEAVEVIDRLTANSKELASRIREANFVYLSGGKPSYLHDSLAGTLTWDAILSVLARGGVVAGCSAGAMIWGEIIPGYPVPWPWKPGFAFLPKTAVIPHFDEISVSFAGLVRSLLPKQMRMLGVDGNTALIVAPDENRVHGAGRVVIWDEQGKREFREGNLIQ